MCRVVVTGMGVISPVGNDIDTFWESLKAGKCGVDKIKRFDASGLKVSLDAEVKEFEPKKLQDRLLSRVESLRANLIKSALVYI